jgi:hypothetical protein
MAKAARKVIIESFKKNGQQMHYLFVALTDIYAHIFPVNSGWPCKKSRFIPELDSGFLIFL